MKWISVKDRMPDNKQEVLIYGPYEGKMIMEICLFVFSCGKPLWLSLHTADPNEATHWMPLPKAPKEKNK